MGYMCHDTIVVTSWDKEKLAAAHAKACELFACATIHPSFGREGEDVRTPTLVSPIISGVINQYASFFVAPDGSKEGWDASDNGDTAREEFVKYLRSKAEVDGSSSLDYVEVQFGDEDLDTLILNSSNDDYKLIIAEDEDADANSN